jgi:hypothetical protein
MLSQKAPATIEKPPAPNGRYNYGQAGFIFV